MKKFRVGLIICAIIIIIAQLILIDYNNLTGIKNAGSYLGIISMIFLIILGIISYKHDKKLIVKK
jgi:hypothetical protein